MPFIILLLLNYFYRPQRSCGQGNIFAPVCHSIHNVAGGGVSASVLAGMPHAPSWEQAPGSRHTPGSRSPPGCRSPWEQIPWSRHPLGADVPQSKQPQRADTPPREADSSIRSMSSRYASYVNAFLLEYANARRLIH